MKRSLLKPRLQLLFRSTCLFATSLTPLARAGEFLFDNNALATYPADWATANNWNPNTVPNGPLDNAIFANVAGGINNNPTALTNFEISGVTSGTLNQLRFTSAPANATAVNLTSTSTQTLNLNQIIVSGNVPNPPTVGGTAANNGPWQIGPNVELNAVVDPLYNPTGKLRVINTATGGLQLQGRITTGVGGLVKNGGSLVRLGTSGATFENSIGGDIVINNGTLQASNAGSGNVLGGTGKVIINGPGSTLQMLTDYAANYGRDVVINANATLATDRSNTTTTGQEITLGQLTAGADDRFLSLNSANSYSYRFSGVNLGSNTLHIRNGLNNTANTDATGHASLGALTGSGTLNVSGSGGNSTVGMIFDAPSPAFTGRINLFENGNHLAVATGAFGSANVVLGEATNDLPINYPNIAIGSNGAPVIQSNPWSSLLKYNANNLTTGTITVNGASRSTWAWLREQGIKSSSGPMLSSKGMKRNSPALMWEPVGISPCLRPMR